MELISVRAAVVLFYVQMERVNPLRKAKSRELTRKLTERYEFLKFPQTYDEFNDADGGVLFAEGSFEGVEVTELKIFSNGFLINTGESTDVAERLFDDLVVLWRNAGLNLVPEMVTGKSYISQLAVRSDIDLLAVNMALAEVIENWFPKRSAGISAIGIHTNENVDRVPSIRLERLVGVPVGASQFYAQAPLPTTLHLSFLTRWETVLREFSSFSANGPQQQP